MKLIKKLPALLTALSMLFSPPALAQDLSTDPIPLPDVISVEIDGAALNMTGSDGSRVSPFVENGTTYVPVRAVAEAFELSVSWDQATKTVFIGEQGGAPMLNDFINIYIDGSEFIARDAGGKRVYPILRDGTTYMPIRAVGEALGKSVFWDNVLKTAVIITPLSENDKASLKKILSDTAALKGYSADFKFYIAASEHDLLSPDIHEVIEEAGSDSLIFEVLPDDAFSCVYCNKSGSDFVFGASIDSGMLLDFADIPTESLSGLELGRASLLLSISNGIITNETASIPVRYTLNGQSDIALLVLNTDIYPNAG